MLEMLARQLLDTRQELVAYPLQYEAVGRYQCQAVVFGLEPQRLDPGLVLLRRQLLLEAGQAEAPETVHRWGSVI
jgi:hypothetical protein